MLSIFPCHIMVRQFTHPGIVGGVAFPIAGGAGHTLAVPVELGFYSHIRNHDGLFLNSGIAYTYQFDIGFELSARLPAGALITLTNVPVYSVEQGQVSELPGQACVKFMPLFELEAGWDLNRISLPFCINIGFQTFGEYLFNTYMLLHLAVRAGVSFDPTFGGKI